MDATTVRRIAPWGHSGPLKSYRRFFKHKMPLAFTPYLKRGGAIARRAGYRGYFPKNRMALLGTGLAAAGYYGSRYGPKLVKRFRRRFKRVAPSRPGFNRNRVMARRYVTWLEERNPRADKTLYNEQLTNIPKQSGTGTNDFYVRTGDLVTIKGFKLHIMVQNRVSVPITFNWAILQPRNSQVITDNNFFRSDGNPFVTEGASRGVDFIETMSYFDMATKKINTDGYKIIKHEKFNILGRSNVEWGVDPSKCWHKIERWIPINRNFRYDDGTTQCTTPLYVVFWAVRLDTLSTTAASPLTYNLNGKCTAFFTNPLRV